MIDDPSKKEKWKETMSCKYVWTTVTNYRSQIFGMITSFFYLRQLKRTKVRVPKLVITFSVGRFYIYLVLYDITFKVKRIFKSQTKVVNIRIESFIFQWLERNIFILQIGFWFYNLPHRCPLIDVSLATSLHLVISANHLMVIPNTVKPFRTGTVKYFAHS